MQEWLGRRNQRLQFIAISTGAHQTQTPSDFLGGLDRYLGELLVIDKHRCAGGAEDVGRVRSGHARIERHEHRAGEWDGVVRGEHDVRISGQDGDTIARLDPQCPERSRDSPYVNLTLPSTTPSRSGNICAARWRNAVGVSGS